MHMYQPVNYNQWKYTMPLATNEALVLMYLSTGLLNRCLKDGAGDVAFVKHLTVPGQCHTASNLQC